MIKYLDELNVWNDNNLVFPNLGISRDCTMVAHIYYYKIIIWDANNG